MEIVQTWTTVLKNNIAGAPNMPPTADLFDSNAFYVSDGVGSAYAAMRFRKISLETGEELANVHTRNWVRCICENEESIYAVLDKRILRLNRKDFRLEESYTKNVPRYSDYAHFVTKDTLFLICAGGSMFQQFDLQQQKSRRKKIGNDFYIYHVAKAAADDIYIFTEQEVFQYAPKSDEIRKLLDIEPCREYIMDSAGKTYLLCSRNRSRPRSSRILVYSTLTDNNPETLFPGCVAAHFWLSEHRQQLYLAYDNKLWIYSLAEKKVIFHHIFDAGYIINIFVETNTVLTYGYGSENCLTCHRII